MATMMPPTSDTQHEPRFGSLFSGYGGLDMGTQAILGGSTAWVSDIDPGACKILAHRYPDVPNLGDITTVDWSQVEPVDVLTGGFPCQDVSAAGKRAGIRPGTRSGLWTQFAYAISQLRPSLVLIENVRGLLSATAHSDVEPCPWCLGDRPDGHLRALGAVLGDLADLGYDASWYGLRAADVGAPHGRFRVFVVAYPEGDEGRLEHRDGAAVAVAENSGHERSGRARNGWSGIADGCLFPTPRAGDGDKGGPNQRGSSGDLMLPSAVHLLPTPVAQEPGGTLDQYHARLKASDGRDSTFAPLSMAVQLLPTPKASDGEWGLPRTSGWPPEKSTHLATALEFNPWGQYADAIARWENVTRPAPAPTELSTKGTLRLSAAFSEWLMGVPAGWITDVPNITRNEALKAAGNGVVPQQAEAALRFLLAAKAVAA